MNRISRAPLSLVLLLLSVSAVPDAQNSSVVVDALGREILLDAPPERIVIAGPATLMIADALYLFETGPESLGLPVVYFDFETPEQYQRDISTMGRLLGEQERAREITRYLEGRRSEVVGVTSTLPPDERPSVLFLYVDNRGGDRAFNVPPDGWIQTTLVREAGGEPVWTGIPLGSGWSTVTMEQIARWDPEIVLFVAYRQDASEVAERLRSDPVWRNLTAVRNGRAWAVPVDFYSWNQPDIRWILGLEWTAYALHPDRFPNLSIPERVYAFYERLYALSREETDRIIFSILEGDLLPERSN